MSSLEEYFCKEVELTISSFSCNIDKYSPCGITLILTREGSVVATAGGDIGKLRKL